MFKLQYQFLKLIHSEQMMWDLQVFFSSLIVCDVRTLLIQEICLFIVIMYDHISTKIAYIKFPNHVDEVGIPHDSMQITLVQHTDTVLLCIS